MKKNNLLTNINVDYASPSEVIIAFSFIKIFSNLNIKNKIIIKIL